MTAYVVALSVAVWIGMTVGIMLGWYARGGPSHRAPEHPVLRSGFCALCGKPATGWAFINDKRYCHGDFDQSPTCYENAQGYALCRPSWYLRLVEPPPTLIDGEALGWLEGA